MQLKVVLLPEPFGPISPRISPSFTSKETSFTARRAPNLLVRPETLNIAMRAFSKRRSAALTPSSILPLSGGGGAGGAVSLPLKGGGSGWGSAYFAYACPFGSGKIGSALLICGGHTTLVLPSTNCITTAIERSFCPAIGVPGPANFTP